MDWLGIVLIALITGAIFFGAGYIAALLWIGKSFKSHSITISKPSYFPEEKLHEIMRQEIETMLIKEGAIRHHDDGKFKTKTVIFYLKEEDDEGL